MPASPIGSRRRGEPGASPGPQNMRDAMLGALRTKAADAPASNEAPRPVAAAAPAPELKGKGAEVRGLEARYNEIVDDQIDAQGRKADAALIKSAALARKGSFVVSAMAEPTGRFLALGRRIEELVGLDNAELAKIANEPMPEEAPERAVEARTPGIEVAATREPKSEIQTQLENLSGVEGLGGLMEDLDMAKLKSIVVEGLGGIKTDWSKVELAYLEDVEKVLEDLKADKSKAAPEFPFLKVNRINAALDSVRTSIETQRVRMKDIGDMSDEAKRIAARKEQLAGVRETENEIVALMQKQYEIKSRGLDSLHEQLRDYLKTAGLFGGLKGHARDLKRQIRDAEADLDKLMRAIDEKRVSSHKRSDITADGDRARSEAVRAAKSPR